jgi:methylthioribose-1-phosphate isomerase
MEDGRQIAAEDVGRNRAMAKWGGDWLVQEVKAKGGSGDGLNVLTVCNTGSLATSVGSFFSGITPWLTRYLVGIRYRSWTYNLPTRNE